MKKKKIVQKYSKIEQYPRHLKQSARATPQKQHSQPKNNIHNNILNNNKTTFTTKNYNPTLAIGRQHEHHAIIFH